MGMQVTILLKRQKGLWPLSDQQALKSSQVWAGSKHGATDFLPRAFHSSSCDLEGEKV